MTDPTPEELDALVKELITMSNHPESKYARAAAAITALRAREAMIEAAAIERAAQSAANADIGYHDGISGDWHPYAGPTILSGACATIRALITPGARTLLDQRIAEAEQAGYERGAIDAKPQFGKAITLQQAARIMLQSQTVRAMAASWPPRDLVSTLLALSEGREK